MMRRNKYHVSMLFFKIRNLGHVAYICSHQLAHPRAIFVDLNHVKNTLL